MDITVTDEPEQHRYAITADGVYAGEVVYQIRDDRRLLVHVGVDEAFEGKGIAGKAAAIVLDHSRAAGELVVPLCPYMVTYIERHPEYADLVDEQLTARYRTGNGG